MYIVLTSGIFWEEGQLGRIGEKESWRRQGNGDLPLLRREGRDDSHR